MNSINSRACMISTVTIISICHISITIVSVSMFVIGIVSIIGMPMIRIFVLLVLFVLLALLVLLVLVWCLKSDSWSRARRARPEDHSSLRQLF